MIFPDEYLKMSHISYIICNMESYSVFVLLLCDHLLRDSSVLSSRHVPIRLLFGMFTRMTVKVRLISTRTRVRQSRNRNSVLSLGVQSIRDRWSIDKAQCEQGLWSIGDALPNIELLADITQEQRTVREYTRSFYRLDLTMHRLWDGPLSRVRPSVITMSALTWAFVLLSRPHCISTMKLFNLDQYWKSVLSASLLIFYHVF